MLFYERISNNNISVNNTEKKIIEYILDNSNSFSNIIINDMASYLYISPNTIIRLCKKLGYSGFSELKYELVNNSKGVTQASLDNSVITIHNSILETLAINKLDTLKECADLMHKSKKIIIFSLGLSQYPSLAFAKKLQYLNKLCLVPEDRDANILYAKNLKDGDLALVVSSSGNTDIIRTVFTIIKTKKVPMITLTGFSQNILSQFSDIKLYAYLKQYNIDNNDLTSRLGFNIVLDLLIEQYYNILEIK
ncbi:MAG: MurR/RpiR family transcriptional regulator [Clostridium sp.]|uniref:MurR/RpiR family transcriptional regulator n=1 Tax=Clostridium sp. TaxID=1506 RepID=UPI003D6DA242